MNYSFCFCHEICVTVSPSEAFRLLDVLSVLPGLTIYMNREQKDAIQEPEQRHSALPSSQSAENM